MRSLYITALVLAFFYYTGYSQNMTSTESVRKKIIDGYISICNQEFEKADGYLKESQNSIKKTGNKFLEAVTYEFYGYLYYFQKNRSKALMSFIIAKNLYDYHGYSQNTEGSNKYFNEIIAKLQKENLSQDQEKIILVNFNILLLKYKPIIINSNELSKTLEKINQEFLELSHEKETAGTKKLDVIDKSLDEKSSPNVKSIESLPNELSKNISNSESIVEEVNENPQPKKIDIKVNELKTEETKKESSIRNPNSKTSKVILPSQRSEIIKPRPIKYKIEIQNKK